VNSDKSTSRNIQWGPWVIGALGGALLLLGVARFILRHRFDYMDAVYCCLAVVPAGLGLLVLAYVIQHTKVAAVIPLFVAGVLIFSYPIFDVAFGLALLGAIAGPALSEWRTKARPTN
jgi:hypothetical protein